MSIFKRKTQEEIMAEYMSDPELDARVAAQREADKNRIAELESKKTVSTSEYAELIRLRNSQ